MSAEPPKSPPQSRAERDRRLAEALRSNLRRRKEQSRDRDGTQHPALPPEAPCDRSR